MFSMSVNDDISLKILTSSDAKRFYQLTDNNREYLERFMPRIIENKSVDDSIKVINLFLRQLEDNNGFRAGIIYKNKLVGIAGLKYIDWINKKTEIMYWIDKGSQGNGITCKCVNKIIEIAFNQYDMNKIIIKSSVSNKASIRIAEKCGFKLEGILKDDELLSDGYTDICYFGLLRNDYLTDNIKLGM